MNCYVFWLKSCLGFHSLFFFAPSNRFHVFLGCIIEEGIDYKDAPIKSKTTEDQQKCADFSASTTQFLHEGLFWTWNKKNKMCYVKRAKGKLVKVGHAVSGSRECGQIEQKPSGS